MGSIRRPETSVRNYQSSLLKNSEEGSSQLFRGGSLKSLLMFIYYSILSIIRLRIKHVLS